MLVLIIFLIFLLPSIALSQNLYSYYILTKELKILSATKEKESYLKVPRYMRIITREEIERLGARNLFELLDNLPEFYYWKSYFGLNSLGALGLKQSYFSEKIKVLINGIPVSDPSNGSSFSVNNVFSLSNVKQVEIIYGPMTSLYGYNASLAIINLVTFSSEDKPKLSVSISSGHDHYNSLFVPINTEKLKGSFSINYIENRSPHRSYTDLLNVKGNFSSYRKDFNYYLSLKHPSGLYIKSYSVDRDDHFPVSISKLITDGNSYARRKAFLNRIGYKFTSSKAFWNIFLDYNWFYLKRGYNICPFNHGICRLFLPHELLAIEKRYIKEPRIGTFLSLPLRNFGKLSIGADLSKVKLYKTTLSANFLPSTANPNNPKSLVTYNSLRDLPEKEKLLPEKTRNTFSPYLQYFINRNDYSLLFNLRWSRTTDVGNDWSYSLSVMKKIDNSIFKLNIGRALRVPSFEEMYIQNNPILKGNPELKIEKLDSVIPSYEYIGDRISVNVALYNLWFKNLIYKRQLSNSSYQWDNWNPTVKVREAAVNVKFKLSPNLNMQLSLGKIFSKKGFSGEYFDFPKGKLISSVEYKTGKVRNILNLIAYSRISSETPGFYKVNYNFIWNLTKNGQISLNIENLLNRKYRFNENVPGEERTLWVSFQYSY